MSFNFLNQGQTDDAATRFSPIDTFIDPVSKIRVSNPSNLIDTDFEYGLQPTKWETVEIINNTPAFFSKGGDTTIPDITGITTNSGTREITVTTAFPHNLDVGIPIRVAGTKSVTADGSYIINAVPTPQTFTYLSRANQPETISIFDLYTSIITGEFFQGSQIAISDAEGIVTDGVGPVSTLTVKTRNKHGFGLNTPFYFLNLNSTISQEFEAQNSSSVSFDPSNSATAQTFDGSNTLLQQPIDLSNSASTSTGQSLISTTDPTTSTITVTHENEDWSQLVAGSPIYYDVNIGAGYFQSNPRGVIFIAEIVSNNAQQTTFSVSSIPNGELIPVLANMTGIFKVADQAKTFAGNNIDPNSQINISVLDETAIPFDGANQGYAGELVDGEVPAYEATVVGFTGNNITIFSADGDLDWYTGAMLFYSSDGTSATGLTNNTTYFVTSFSAGASAGLYNLSIAPLPTDDELTNLSGGTGTQTFTKIGVSADRDIIHVRNAGFEAGDMLEYSYPADGLGGQFTADEEKQFYFVTAAYDTHNFQLSATFFSPTIADGGDVVYTVDQGGTTYNVHVFTTVGTSTFTVETVGTEDDTADVLVVAGGGAGGGGIGGGGGAGGVLFTESYQLSAGSYNVTVGDGGPGTSGNGSVRNNSGGNGQNSSFGPDLTAIGGGVGAVRTSYRAGNGGSGGGGGTGGTGQEGTGTPGQGNNGGNNGSEGSKYPGGGGGGAYEAGQPALSNIWPGDGGMGRFFGRYFGVSVGDNGFFGGGGGGTDHNDPRGYYGFGGKGGGGRTNFSQTNANSGVDGTGGGGGAASYVSSYPASGNGGSGAVIIRYPAAEIEDADIVPMSASGGNQIYTETVNGVDYRVHEFTSVTSHTFSVTEAGNIGEMEVIMWGAGGGAGDARSGNIGHGGGGGYARSFIIPEVGNYTVSVAGYGDGASNGCLRGNGRGIGGVGPAGAAGGNGWNPGTRGCSSPGGGGGAGSLFLRGGTILVAAGGGGGGGGRENGATGNGMYGGGGGENGYNGRGRGGKAGARNSTNGRSGGRAGGDQSGSGGGGGGFRGGNYGDLPNRDADGGGGGGGGISIGEIIVNGTRQTPGTETETNRFRGNAGNGGLSRGGNGANGKVVIRYPLTLDAGGGDV